MIPLQRLYSMFPNGWPGRGLLLLRLADGLLLLHDGVAGMLGSSFHLRWVITPVSAMIGVFVLVGLWTPIAGVVSAAAEASLLIVAGTDLRSALCVIVFSLAIASLGPGVWSIDAVFFGRHRIPLPDRSGARKAPIFAPRCARKPHATCGCGRHYSNEVGVFSPGEG